MLQQLQEWDEKARCSTDTKGELMLDSAFHSRVVRRACPKSRRAKEYSSPPLIPTLMSSAWRISWTLERASLSSGISNTRQADKGKSSA